MKREIRDYLQDILESIEEIHDFLMDIKDFESFANNKQKVYSVIYF